MISPEWVGRLEAFNTLWVGLSGGLDSTVLLHALSSNLVLKEKIKAVYVNHGLSPNAFDWQEHCQAFCHKLGVNFYAHSVRVESKANLEENARTARYELFLSLVQTQECLIVGHHENDQAETLLLNLFRGTGLDGLAAMLEFDSFGMGNIARPILSSSRQNLEAYALTHQLHWVEDESNQDVHYSRNFLRHQIMPLLMSKWPGIVDSISRTTQHCQQALTNLADLAVLDNQELVEANRVLAIKPLASLSLERLVNVLRFWLKRNNIPLPSTITFQRLIHEVLWASPDAMPLVSWSDVKIRRYQDSLYIIRKTAFTLPTIEWLNFPQSLNIGGNLVLSAKTSEQGFLMPKAGVLRLEFRKGGELFIWHGQSKQLKKLMQEWRIPPWERDQIPLLYVGDKLAIVVGYAVSDAFYGAAADAWQIHLAK